MTMINLMLTKLSYIDIEIYVRFFTYLVTTGMQPMGKLRGESSESRKRRPRNKVHKEN
jgi:hypothetical protein